MSHTPGPWTFDDRDPGGYLIRRAGTSRVHVGFCYKGPHEAESNARLIAAAPDLLEAANHLSACDMPDEVDFRCEGCNAARAAIAKAEGR